MLKWSHNACESCWSLFLFWSDDDTALLFKLLIEICFPWWCLQLFEMQRSAFGFCFSPNRIELWAWEGPVYTSIPTLLCDLQERHLHPAVEAIHFCMEEGNNHFLYLVVEEVYREVRHWEVTMQLIYQVIFNKRLPQKIWGFNFYNYSGTKMGCIKCFTFSIYCKWSHFASTGPC